MPTKDYVFEWQDWKHCRCACRARVFAAIDGAGEFAGKTVVLVSDLNRGNSVTNEAEHLATLLCRRESIEIADLVFVEHYPPTGAFEETYDRVEFDWDAPRREFRNPRWTHWTAERVERITGEPLVAAAGELPQRA